MEDEAHISLENYLLREDGAQSSLDRYLNERRYGGNPTDTSYLSYDPKPMSGHKPRSWDTHLDSLGFKHKNIRYPPMDELRDAIQQDINAFLWCPLMQYLRREDNLPAFGMLIQGFLEEFGSVWWGEADRIHLTETDSSKGFLYPRDAQRNDSV